MRSNFFLVSHPLPLGRRGVVWYTIFNKERGDTMERSDAMETMTTLFPGSSLARERADYDAAYKLFLSEKSILGWILHGCAEEYRDCTPQEIAEKYIEGEPQVSVIPLESGAPYQTERDGSAQAEAAEKAMREHLDVNRRMIADAVRNLKTD